MSLPAICERLPIADRDDRFGRGFSATPTSLTLGVRLEPIHERIDGVELDVRFTGELTHAQGEAAKQGLAHSGSDACREPPDLLENTSVTTRELRMQRAWPEI